MNVIRFAMLHLTLAFWRYRHQGAKQFRVDLERVIAYERRRAQNDVEETEVLASRAQAALVAYRADRVLEIRAKA